MYRIIIDSFQKEFEHRQEACGMVIMLINAGLYHINADEVRRGKGVKKATVFVKSQTVDSDNLVEACTTLKSIADALKDFEVNPPIKLITVSKN